MSRREISRRTLLKTGGAALAAPALLPSRAFAADATFKIGLVSPLTGPLAGFGEAQGWILDGVKDALAKTTNKGKPVKIEIIARDSQSNPSRASEVAAELINKHQVNLLLGKDTPDTTNPVADQAELAGVPCITNNCPWQPYFFGRKGDPAKGFDWTYHFFWGLEDVIASYLGIWDQSGAKRIVGGLFPNDADGNAWGDPKLGFPAPLAAAGYKLVDPGRYQPLNNDFSAQISAFKQAGVEIVTGVMIPPDFATFWAQAAQQGFKPKVVTIGKALLFPTTLDSLGARGDGLTTEVWWTPAIPTNPASPAFRPPNSRRATRRRRASNGRRRWAFPMRFWKWPSMSSNARKTSPTPGRLSTPSRRPTCKPSSAPCNGPASR